jgi:AraC family transcriptional regulator of adaptative response / DNA-3-methyladenine glycosylase II
MKLIAEGALDESEAGVEAFAEKLGVGGRQLRRLFSQHLGASPIAVAQTRRVLFAKHLIHDTQLPMTEVALSAGFGSVRRFNETFRNLFGRPPSALRRKQGPDNSASEGVTLRLSYRPPYDWPGILDALRARAAKKIEWIEDGIWHRQIELDGTKGTVSVAHLPERNAVAVTIHFPEVRALPTIVARVKRVFDLGADILTIDSHLARDPKLAPLIAKRPGVRAPGDWDGEIMPAANLDTRAPAAWRPWHAYAEQHLRLAANAA